MCRQVNVCDKLTLKIISKAACLVHIKIIPNAMALVYVFLTLFKKKKSEKIKLGTLCDPCLALLSCICTDKNLIYKRLEKCTNLKPCFTYWLFLCPPGNQLVVTSNPYWKFEPTKFMLYCFATKLIHKSKDVHIIVSLGDVFFFYFPQKMSWNEPKNTQTCIFKKAIVWPFILLPQIK